MKVTQDGKEYEFLGYWAAKKGEHYLSVAPKEIRKADGDHKDVVSAIFRPVQKEYCFGNVVFQETGEERSPTDGDWWVEKCAEGGPLLRLYRKEWSRPVRIVKPVRILP